MRIDRATADAERLNEFWDRLVEGNAPADDAGHHPNAPERQLEALVLYLESLKPHMSLTSLGALDLAMSHLVAEDLPMNATTPNDRDRSTTATLPGTRTSRSRIGLILRAFDGLAAALLILILVSGLVLIGPARNFLDSEVPGQFASMLGVDEDDSTEQSIGSHSVTSIDVRPGEYDGDRVEVGLWEVELPPGSAMTAAPTGVEPPMTFGFSVSSGAVVFMSNGKEQPAGPDVSVGGHPGLDYVRNTSTDPATLLVLASTPSTATFPLTIDPWVPAGSPAASPAIDPASLGAEPVLFGSAELTDEAFQYRVLLTENVLAPGMSIGGALSLGPPEAQLRSVTVRSGELRLEGKGSQATPQPPRAIAAGETLVDEDDIWSIDLRVTGSENATVLGLMTMPAADNHTLDQTLESIAPFWGEWTVPASGEVRLAVRLLTLQPDGTYSLPTDAGVLYHVATGAVAMVNSDSGNTQDVSAGGTVAQIPGTVLALSNPGSSPVAVIQTLAFTGSLRELASGEAATNGETALLVEQGGTIPPGEVTLMLEVSRFNGGNDGGGASQGGQSLALLTSADGKIQVSRIGGDAEVFPAGGDGSYRPSLGEYVRIGVGDSLLVQPGGGWDITGASGAPSLGLVLTVSPASPNLQPASPAASPEATVTGSYELVGEAAACDIDPLTIDLVDNIVTTPSIAPTLGERSLRGAADGASDPASTDEIVALLQAYADCSTTGDYTRIYAFYSDQAIRESESIQEMVESTHDFGEAPRVIATVEDIMRFPDGRAGARTVIDGEAAYLTFVMQDGQWKIDAWDDSDSRYPPEATPAS